MTAPDEYKPPGNDKLEPLAVPARVLPMVMTPVVIPEPILIVLVALPMATVVALVLPRLTVAVPAPAESRVKLLAAAELIVKDPESTMLLVVKVWEPMTVPVMKVPTPVLLILVVPPSERSPVVIATLPAVAT